MQLGTPDRVLQRSHMSSYSLPLPVSVMITWNSFGCVWTSSHYSAQPPTPILHESSPMRSLLHPIGSCEGPACIAHPYPFLSVSVTWSSIESHYYMHRVVLHQVGSLSCIGSHCIGSHRIGLHCIGSCCIGSCCIRSCCIGLCHSPC